MDEYGCCALLGEVGACSRGALQELEGNKVAGGSQGLSDRHPDALAGPRIPHAESPVIIRTE
jgi:hypothetical protein